MPLKKYDLEILNAIPMPIFVVDDDVNIVALNDFAADFFRLETANLHRRRAGDVLHCLHSNDVAEGCGRGPACKDCRIRGSIGKSFSGQSVMRTRTKFHVIRGGVAKEMELLISTNPVPKHPGLALLVIEDITEISTLHQIIPICAKCKKIRDDQEYWHSVEQYFHQFIGVDFSHGLCPPCMHEVYPEYVDKNGAPHSPAARTAKTSE